MILMRVILVSEDGTTVNFLPMLDDDNDIDVTFSVVKEMDTFSSR